MNMNEPPSLLRNDYAGGEPLARVELEGTTSNRSALGATVIVTVSGRTTQAQAVLSQSSYYSHDDLRLHFGLGAQTARRRDRDPLAVGRVETLSNVRGDRVVAIREGARPSK